MKLLLLGHDLLIADNKVIMGFGGNEFAARGRVTAFNLKDGSEAWTCHSTGSDADVCLTSETNKANPHFGTAGYDLGIKTFPGDDYKIGGGAAWAWLSYDPELKLVYFGTGNPGLWSPSYRCPDRPTKSATRSILSLVSSKGGSTTSGR